MVPGPKLGTVYIDKVSGAKNVKSDEQLLRPHADFSQLIFSKLLELSESSRARKLLLGLQVNIDKANSHGYDITW